MRCTPYLKCLSLWAVVAGRPSTSPPSGHDDPIPASYESAFGLEERAPQLMSKWLGNDDSWKTQITWVGFRPSTFGGPPTLKKAQDAAKDGYSSVKAQKLTEVTSGEAFLVAALCTSRGTFISTIPAFPARKWLRENGQARAPIHDWASSGRGRGDCGIWHAENAACARYEMQFPTPQGQPTNQGYPVGPGWFIAVHGIYDGEKDADAGPRPPCYLATGQMPAGTTCHDTVTRLNLRYQ